MQMKVLASAALWLLIKVNLGLRYLIRRRRKETDVGTNPNFVAFQRQYFVPHFIALFGDWLQAPYLYALYSSYGFEEEQIAVLYACGLASALLLSAIGLPSLTGNLGRKSVCMAAAVTYAAASLMYASKNYGILLIGRILSGASAAALFDSLESWYAHEHLETHDFPREWLPVTFASAAYWSGLIAAVAGGIAYCLADVVGWGPIAPFALAVPFFLAAAVTVGITWNENYGRQVTVRSSSSSGGGGGSPTSCCGRRGKACMSSLREIRDNRRLMLLGVIQSLFESVLYVFVFLWTPVLSGGSSGGSGSPSSLPLGIVFATFMVCTMIGSSLAELAEAHWHAPRVTVLLVATSGALAAGVVCSLFSGVGGGSAAASSSSACFVAYLLYECCAGAYFSVMARLRQQAAPDAQPTAVAALGFFRLPMNLIACVLLMLLHDDSFRHGNRLIFAVCSALLLAALLCVCSLLSLEKATRKPAAVAAAASSSPATDLLPT